MAFWNSRILWAAIRWLIQRQFPQVSHLTGQTLADWLAKPDSVKPMLLDVRTQAEYDVSHLPEAIRVDPQLEDMTQLDLPTHPVPIVTYCSVGYRSAAFAQRLLAAGCPQVSNLEGSIFQWANQGHPVYHDGTPVHQVHPYNSLWGYLLQPQLRADVSAR